MTRKQIIAVVAYVGAVIGPATALVARFGLNTRLDVSNSSEAVEQLLGLGGAIATGFLLSILASRLIAAETETLTTFALRILRNQRDSSNA